MTQERKDQLYDQMIAWICEHIPNDEDLFLTLHGHFGMTKDELHDNSIESLDRFFPRNLPALGSSKRSTPTLWNTRNAGCGCRPLN